MQHHKGSVVYTGNISFNRPTVATDERLCRRSKWLTKQNRRRSQRKLCYGRLELPEKGPYESSISWTSGNEAFLKPDGTLIRPSFDEGNQLVILTAILSRGDKSFTKTFEILIAKLGQTDAEAVSDAIRRFYVSQTLGDNLSQYSIRSNLFLSGSGANGTTSLDFLICQSNIEQWRGHNPRISRWAQSSSVN